MNWQRKLGLTVVGLTIGYVVLPALQIGPRPSQGGGTTIPVNARVAFLAACPAGWTQDATLDGTMLLATTAAHGDVGGTGGANNITPAGTNSTPTFTGNSVASSATSAGTPAGTNSAPALTMNAYTPAGTNGTSSTTPAGTVGTPVLSWPAGVPVFTGSSGTVPAQTFTGSSGTVPAETISGSTASESSHTHTYTQVPNHVHPDTAVLNMQGGTTAATTGTHVMNSTATGGSVRAITAGDNVTITAVNPTGGVATGTTAAGSAHSHGVGTLANGTVSFTPAGTNGTVSFTPAGTNAWPAGVPTSTTPSFTGSSSTVSAQTFTGTQATLTGSVAAPTFTGSALGTHTHTTTATGSVSAPSFTGTQFDNRSAYTKVIWCQAPSSSPVPAPQPLSENGKMAWMFAFSVMGLLGGSWLARRSL